MLQPLSHPPERNCTSLIQLNKGIGRFYRMLRIILLYSVCLLCCCFLPMSLASSSSKHKKPRPTLQQFKKNIAAQVQSQGVRPALVQRYLMPAQLTVQVKQIQHSIHPKTKPAPITFEQYWKSTLHACPQDLLKIKYQQMRVPLRHIIQQYGVPAGYLMGIWCTETRFGKHIGKRPLIDSLLTLAYLHPSRTQFFSQQLAAALVMLNSSPKITKTQLTSTFDGGMGQTQLEPVSYLQYAVKYSPHLQAKNQSTAKSSKQQASSTKNSKSSTATHSQTQTKTHTAYPINRITPQNFSDVWNNSADALASAANYLAQHHWQRKDPCWGQQVNLSEGIDWQEFATKKTKLSLRMWRKIGIKSNPPYRCHPKKAYLVLPDGIKGNAYLVYPNFDVLLTWNPRIYEALAISLMHDQLEHINRQARLKSDYHTHLLLHH